MVDVRSFEEFEESHIEGSLHWPLAQLSELSAGYSKERQIYLFCQKGPRATLAEEFLRQNGYDAVRSLGGIDDVVNLDFKKVCIR